MMRWKLRAMAEAWSQWMALKEEKQLSSERLTETDIEREEIAEEEEMREMGGQVQEQDASGRGDDDGGGMGDWSIETWIEVARSMQEVKMEMRQLVVQARQGRSRSRIRGKAAEESWL